MKAAFGLFVWADLNARGGAGKPRGMFLAKASDRPHSLRIISGR